jgi:hypothetical protein
LFTARTPLGREVPSPISEIEKGGQLGVGYERNAAAPTAVPTIGAAARHVFLSTIAHGASAARTRPHHDARFVDELD